MSCWTKIKLRISTFLYFFPFHRAFVIVFLLIQCSSDGWSSQVVEWILRWWILLCCKLFMQLDYISNMTVQCMTIDWEKNISIVDVLLFVIYLCNKHVCNKTIVMPISFKNEKRLKVKWNISVSPAKKKVYLFVRLRILKVAIFIYNVLVVKFYSCGNCFFSIKVGSAIWSIKQKFAFSPRLKMSDIAFLYAWYLCVCVCVCLN